LKNSVTDTAPCSSIKQPTTQTSVQSANQGPSIQSSLIPLSPMVLDQQAEMMTLFANLMSKLSLVLSEKSESKSDWPKFTGDQKKFRAWHLAIMAQLLLPPWVELYDATMNDIVENTSNSTLNGKLYSKLLLVLDGTALKNIVSRKHLRANGLLLLCELVQTYQPRNVPEVIAFKTSEFWGNTKRYPTELIDDYYNHFHELLDDLADAEEPISTRSAI
jgi:hypothetical protein